MFIIMIKNKHHLIFLKNTKINQLMIIKFYLIEVVDDNDIIFD
jgi:hypothetical protein